MFLTECDLTGLLEKRIRKLDPVACKSPKGGHTTIKIVEKPPKQKEDGLLGNSTESPGKDIWDEILALLKSSGNCAIDFGAIQSCQIAIRNILFNGKEIINFEKSPFLA
ncbi:hypothetical protein Y1Q_0003867 [Alligator mississippiensis]|uniref:Uncharacterized protein n=1 Tax=Alligator mississippiensis TaxID=8496 RepID=A0A151MNJ4_ALLMI|nr:hypothetical protein Y1Q_0003867 [Alligator mississippiensis]